MRPRAVLTDTDPAVLKSVLAQRSSAGAPSIVKPSVPEVAAIAGSPSDTVKAIVPFAAPGVAVMFLYFHRPWADWLALTLFISAAVTDWFDGYLARAWKQESKFGAMLDPIADKAMVVIALVIITGYSGMNPWLILPVTFILFREVFVSGLREFLGGLQVSMPVSKLAKWKTTFQLVSLGALILGGAVHGQPCQSVFEGCGTIAESWVHLIGLVSLWTAAVLTCVTGWDYLRVGLKHMD